MRLCDLPALIVASAALIAHMLDSFGELRLLPGASTYEGPTAEEPPMYSSVHAAFVAFTTRFEGSTDYMYPDQEGLVSSGRGNLLDLSLDGGAARATPWTPALRLSWTKADGTLATPDEVRLEWYRAKSYPPSTWGWGGGAFAKGAQLHATPASIASLIEAELTSFEAELRKTLNTYDASPADAQLAILDMAWAMGPGFPHAYPHWTAAVLAGDWVTAALECAISHPVNASITARNAANALLFRNAAQVTARKLAAEALYYPRDLAAEAGASTPAAAGQSV